MTITELKKKSQCQNGVGGGVLSGKTGDDSGIGYTKQVLKVCGSYG